MTLDEFVLIFWFAALIFAGVAAFSDAVWPLLAGAISMSIVVIALLKQKRKDDDQEI